MKALAIFFLLFSAAMSPALAQDTTDTAPIPYRDSTLRVTNILIAGNELTKDFIIEREMTLKVGSLVTHDAVAYDINRIYSLQLFNKVDIQVIPDSDKATLIVLVSERWYFYPFPILGFKDHTWQHVYYGAGVVHTNFRGRKELVSIQTALGYDPFASVQYVNPVLDRAHNLFFSTKLLYSVQRNKSLVSLSNGPNFDERTYDGQVTLGKRFSIFSTTTATVEYTHLNVSDNRAGRTLSPGGTDQFFSLNASYIYDTRDLGEYSRVGTFSTVSISKFGIANTYVDYQRYGFDFRRYIPVYFNSSFAFRIFGSAAQGGDVPNYGHVFFGYTDRIRGRFNTIVEGEDILGGKAELRIPVIGPNYIRLDEIPIEQFRDIRYAMYFTIFGDAGTAWYRTQPLAIDNALSGFGAGLNFLLSYSFVARAEYAFGGPGFHHGQVILDLGASL
ncbi:MAG TPA: POTRA domain-containing protein [Bacteroidota bacterium]|nr:POTRA domain-containing protein [Bacteroidota bacterium]